MPLSNFFLEGYKEYKNNKEIEEMNKSKINTNAFIKDKQKEIDEDLEKRKNKHKKEYKESNVLKGRSDLIENKNKKRAVETQLNIRKGLSDKVKRALKKSLNTEFSKKISGNGLFYDSSSDEEDDKPVSKRQAKINELNKKIDEAHKMYLSTRGDKRYTDLMVKLQRELTGVYNSNYGLDEPEPIKVEPKPIIEKPKPIIEKPKQVVKETKKEEEKEGLTKKDLEDLKYWKDKLKKNDKEEEEYKKTGKINGKKVPISKRNEVENDFMNNDINWKRYIKEIEFRPELKRIIKEIKKAYKSGEITETQMEKMIEGSEYGLHDELELLRRNNEKERNKKPFNFDKQIDINILKTKLLKKTTEDYDDSNKAQEYEVINDYENAKKIYMKIYKRSIKDPLYKSIIGTYYEDPETDKKTIKEEPKIVIEETPKPEPKKRGRPKKVITDEPKPEPKKRGRPKKVIKEEPVKKEPKKKDKLGNIMKVRSDVKKNKDKITVDTEMNIRKGLSDKVKSALKSSINVEFDRIISGMGYNKKDIDYLLKYMKNNPNQGEGLTCSKVSPNDVCEDGYMGEIDIPIKHKPYKFNKRGVPELRDEHMEDFIIKNKTKKHKGFNPNPIEVENIKNRYKRK
jgi:hypothetical protein